MDLITIILLLATIYLAYRDHVLSDAYKKQLVLTTEYIRLLFFTMDEENGTEDDLKKQVWRSWTYDGRSLTTGEFDKKWSIICEACGIRPIKNANGITSDIIDGIVHVIYLNRHTLDPITKGYPKTLTLDHLKRMDQSDEELWKEAREKRLK